MLSRTSCFNTSIFLNTLKRFWPVWLGYFAVWVLALPVPLVGILRYQSELQVEYNILLSAHDYGIVITAVFGLFSAAMVWSFVYNPKTMSGVACLPVRREGVFCSAALAGFAPMLAANVLVCLAAMLLTAMDGAPMFGACLQWLAIVTLMLLFFYGFATLCAQLTGNIIVLPVVYAVLMFTAWVVESLVRSLMELLIYGFVSGGMSLAYWLSPVMALANAGPDYVREYNPATDEYRNVDVYFDGWGIIIIFALVGIVMLLGALALYRRRRMESVGDVVAVNVLKPVFKYCLSFGCALVGGTGLYYMLLDHFDLAPLAEVVGITLFMIFSAFIGYFAAEMLIHKSFRVFRGKWRGLGVSLLVIVALMGAMEFDLFGIERRVPEASEIESVHVRGSDSVGYTQPENIEKAIEIHRSIIENKAENEALRSSRPDYEYATEYICFTYVFTDGSTLQRDYQLSYLPGDESTQTDLLAIEELQNSLEAIAHRKALGFEFTEDTIISGSVMSWLREAELEELGESLDAETYIFEEYYGYDSEYVEKYMSAEEREMLLEEYYAKNGSSEVVMDRYHEYEFSAEEMHELYTQCILPDLAEGKIGKLWLIADEEYRSTAYAASIRIEMWYEGGTEDVYYEDTYVLAETTAPQAVESRTYTFTIVPTAESSRTTQWLRDHGVILHTVAEQMEVSGTVYGK